MTGRTELIGLVSSTFSNPSFMQVFDLFTRRLQAQGLRPLLANLAGGGRCGRGLVDAAAVSGRRCHHRHFHAA